MYADSKSMQKLDRAEAIAGFSSTPNRSITEVTPPGTQMHSDSVRNWMKILLNPT